MALVFNKNKKQTLTRNHGNGHAEMREYQTRLGLLCDIAEEASSITQVSTLLERILRVTQRTVGSSITSVFMKDEARSRVHLPITVSIYEDAARRQAAVIESEIAALVAGSAASVLSNNVAADPRFNPKGKKTAGSIVKSIIAAPILKGKKVIGVLTAANKDNGRGFTQRDFEVLKGFAATEAFILLVSLEKTAIDNVNSLHLNQGMLEGYRNTVHELASTIDVKDARVYDHSRRTKEYALLAAGSLPLTPQELQAIEFGALLHDIGKIGIDSEILCKPGPLTDEEWKIVYEHPQKGADILKDIPHLKDAMNIVLCHHERYDGTGYPKKLKGDAIPIGARLVAVSNAFDAMTTDNPYRAALSVDEAMRELIDGTGTQFCPKAVEAFVSAFKKHRGNMPATVSPREIKTKEARPTGSPIIMVDKDTKDTNNLIIKVKKEAKEAKKVKIKAEKASKEAKARAEKEAKEARIKAEKVAKEAKIKAENIAKEAKTKAEKEAIEAKILKAKAEKEAKEAKIKAEKEARIKAEEEAKKARIQKTATEKKAKEAKILKMKAAEEVREAKIQAEKEAREAKIKAEKIAQELKIQKIQAEKAANQAKIKAQKKARETKIKADEEAKKAKKAEQPRKANPARIDMEVFKGNVRLVAPITNSSDEVKAFGRDLEKIEGVKILMLSHSEEEGHLLLLGLEKPITLIHFIKEMPRVEDVDKKGGAIWVALRDGHI